MSNFISSQKVNPKNSIVLTFDLNSNCNTYAFGLSKTLDNSSFAHHIKINRNKISWLSNGIPSTTTNTVTGQTIIFNLDNKFLGYEIDFIPDPDYDMNKVYSHTATQNYGYTTHKFTKNGKEIDFKTLDLGYKCFITSEDFAYESFKEYPIYKNNKYYYQSTFNVVPFVCQEQDDTIILLENNSNEAVVLNLDYGVSLNPYEYNISTVESYINGNLVKTEHFTSPEYDKVRFVMSDYGRIISHTVHHENSKHLFEKPTMTVFDTEKITQPFYVRFYVDKDASVSNITSNF